MRYLTLPIHIILFWYPESLIVFVRTWKNLISYLEEDLAVGLMLRLIWVPLFHDKSIVGRALSLFFRLFRILLGIFAFAFTTVSIILIAIIWFTLPLSAIIFTAEIGLICKILFLSGIGLFLIHTFSHPHKKVWQIKADNLKKDIWSASCISAKNISLKKLLTDQKVIKFLSFLELKPGDFEVLPDSLKPEDLTQKAYEIAKKTKSPYLSVEHWFAAYLKVLPETDDFLIKLNLSNEDFVNCLDYLQKRADMWRLIGFWDDEFETHHLKGINRGWLGTPTQTLDSVSEDITAYASDQEIPDFIGRAEVVAQVINTLSLSEGRNVILVGEPGVGKGALVRYLAKMIVGGDAPSALATKRLVYMDFARLMSGIKEQGELAERVKTIFEEAKESENIIFFIDEIQNFGLGEAGTSFNLLSMVLPYIESTNIQFITTTEPVMYAKVLERNGAFVRLFHKIDLPAASTDDTIEILKNRAIEFEKKNKVKTSFPSLLKIVSLAQRYIHDRVLPDSALDFYKKCQINPENKWITKMVAEKTLQSEVQIPIGEINEENKNQVLNLEETIHQRLIDQEEAVTAVANALRRASAELRDLNRPIGSFLFVGPTGVGKTELSKILSEVYFIGKGNFLRLDMSEYQETDSIRKIIGDEENDGYLTGEIKNRPYSLILLDEFEKADSKILNLFLQVFDDGRLTDGKGKTIDFTNTIIIATSNAASLIIARSLQSGKTVDDIMPEVKDELMKVFRPELLNRFDATVIFKPLSKDDLKKIVVLKLNGLKNQLKNQGYLVEFDESVIEALAIKGFDPVMGARPLRRLIQDTLEARLSVMILENKLNKGELFRANMSAFS